MGERETVMLPPQYSGSRFRTPAITSEREAPVPPPRPTVSPDIEEIPPADTALPEETSVENPEEKPERERSGGFTLPSIFGSLSREEILLIGLLLLLSAEDERAMDVIVILLLLLVIQ